ncbi:MAG: FAD-dependent oxidoreductase [Actinomycetota bacterium]
MSVRSFDVIVVGAGVMGSATARALARAGKKVALLEQFGLGHTRGSSHGRARIFRFSYPDPLYVGMAMEALDLWREAEREADDALIVTTGGLDVGPNIDANARALQDKGAPFEMLEGRDAARRFPAVSLPADRTVLYHPDAGICLADRALNSFVASAQKAKAEILERRRVERLEVSDEQATIHAGDEVFVAPVAVVTAGAWARGLLEPVGIDLPTRATRETVGFFAHDGETLPTLVEWGPPHIYALPSPGQGIKAGEHIAGPTTDPDEDGSVNEESIKRVAAWVAERFPHAHPVPHHAETCLYTNTDDERFILERHGPIVVGSPCSGHGFKFAPLIGRRLADLATG